MTKILYVDDKIHEHLKREAKRQGRTLQWIVEDKLMGNTTKPTVMEETIQEPTIVADSQEWEPSPSTSIGLDDMLKSGMVKRGI